MFNLLNTWNNFWKHSHTARMPLTEKEPGERVPYPYAVKKIKIDGDIEIAYVDEGVKDAGVLLFIHGMGTGLPTWRKNMSMLTKRYRCIALDLPGHGFSDKGYFPYTIAFYTQCVISFIKKLALHAPTLIGHSMGAQTAFMVALKEPQLVNKLVMVAPSGVEPYTPVEKQLLIQTMAGVVASGNAFTHNKLNQIMGFRNDYQQASDFASSMAWYTDEAKAFGILLSRSVESMLLEGIDGILGEVRQPCLIVAGTEDFISPWIYLRGENFAELLAKQTARMANAKLVILPEGGHFVPYQMPDALNKELVKFIEEKHAVTKILEEITNGQ
ncbi:alpha/beta hydrolase [Dyadobacter flavalbus]|uniref:Alpha/beta hydrolase n=1 Tax=Dyadobacter flavalbus TaxID=2579942 RepID=A0A5M8QC81_9BACT|nr:alpha/beta hydrolase [Dyadobacter flavalbus]KAA6432651.1 alpha/beta hydrolase [Dyadobacter flavalbus]